MEMSRCVQCKGIGLVQADIRCERCSGQRCMYCERRYENGFYAECEVCWGSGSCSKAIFKKRIEYKAPKIVRTRSL